MNDADNDMSKEYTGYAKAYPEYVLKNRFKSSTYWLNSHKNALKIKYAIAFLIGFIVLLIGIYLLIFFKWL